MPVRRQQVGILRKVFTQDLRDRERDVKQTCRMMFILAIAVFMISSYLFFHLYNVLTAVAVLLEAFQGTPYWKFLIGYCVVFAIVGCLGWLLVPEPPMKLHGGGTYFIEGSTGLAGKGPISFIVRVLLAFPNWVRMIAQNFFETFRGSLDERMIDFAVSFLDDLEMKRPVDEILWQKHGYTREERLYILGKLVSLGYLWLEKTGTKVYAARSYITDEILRKVDEISKKKEWLRTQEG